MAVKYEVIEIFWDYRYVNYHWENALFVLSTSLKKYILNTITTISVQKHGQ